MNDDDKTKFPTRFQKGKSGNPLGRPKRPTLPPVQVPALHEERVKMCLQEEAYRPIVARDGDKMVAMPLIDAVIRNLGVAAVKGDPGAQRLLLNSVKKFEEENRASYDSYAKAAMEMKADWEIVQELDKRQGIKRERPFPDPDNIRVDPETRVTKIVGPQTFEELARLKEAKRKCDHLIEELIEELKECPNDADEEALKHMRTLRADIEAKMVPD
jgi:hypothetical protein